MEKAVKQTLARAQKLFEKDIRFFAYYADILSKAGDKQKAFKVLKDNINHFPNYTTGELVMGEMFFEQKKFDQAEMLFKGALRKDDSCVKAYRFLSMIEEIKGDKAKSLQMLKMVARLDPFDADAKNIIMLSDKEFSFRGDSAPPEDEEIPDKVIPVVPTQKMEVKPPEQLKKEEVKVPSVSLMNQKSYEEPIHKLDSSEDIEIPEFGFEEKEEIIRKHNISEEALNRERSFSEDIVESLDGLTQSFIEERNSVAAIFDENDSEENAGMTAADFSDIVTAKGSSVDPFKEPDTAPAEEPVAEPPVVEPVAEPVAVFNPVVEPVTEPVAKPAVEPAPHVRKAAETREFDTEYKDSDPKIESLLIELVLSPEMYKVKMESLSKVISEDPRNYENLVEFAIARYKFAAATVKREIQYYSKKVQEEPKNAKYSQNLKSYREEIIKLNSDLKEEMNVLKNEYY